MPVSRQQAVINALRSTTYPVGMCARWTREQFGVQALGDFDGDGDADAVDMWQASKLKNAGDRNPPRGVPVFWSGGSAGHGHAAISLGGGMVRSIDRPRSGLVSSVPLSEMESAWGLKYLGWTIDLYGHEIEDTEVEAQIQALRDRIANKRRNEKGARARAKRLKEQRKKLWARLKGLTG